MTPLMLTLRVTRAKTSHRAKKTWIREILSWYRFVTKATIHHYIGLIDDIGASDEEPEARFLHRIPSANANRPTFAFKDDEGAFPRCDIVKILPKLHQAGGTTRRQTQFVLPCSLSEFNIM